MVTSIKKLKSLLLISIIGNILVFLFLAGTYPNVYTIWGNKKFANDTLIEVEKNKGSEGVKEFTEKLINSISTSEGHFRFYGSFFLVVLLFQTGFNVYCFVVVKRVLNQISTNP